MISSSLEAVNNLLLGANFPVAGTLRQGCFKKSIHLVSDLLLLGKYYSIASYSCQYLMM